MQNLNDLNKMQKMQNEQVQNLEDVKRAPSKFNKFVSIAVIAMLLFLIFGMIFIIVSDNIKTKKQLKANSEALLNSPKMQAQRIQEARRQREFEKRKRLKQLGIDGISKPTQKNDLLNQQLNRQKLAEEQERAESQKQQNVDYRSELAAYNARLREVKEKEARLRAEAQTVGQAPIQEGK